MDDSVSILLAGDTVPTKSNFHLFSYGDAEALVGKELLNLFYQCDLTIANLETPLADRQTPISKWGPNLIAPNETAKGLVSLGVNAVSLANNHIMDQGTEGFESTLNVLDVAGIHYFGAGKNLRNACVPYIYEKNGIKIGVFSCTEHEFSIAEDDLPGANPFDALYSFDFVAEIKSQCDFVLVIYHGGKEHYRYPSPDLQKVCRRFAEKGADLVVCQHSHCIGCVEEWDSSTIVYGQGNFIFDNSESEFWETALLLKIKVRRDSFKVHYFPIKKHEAGVRLAKGAGSEEIITAFKRRSFEILDPSFIKKEYACYAKKNLPNYLRTFIPGAQTIAFRVLYKIIGKKNRAIINKSINYLAVQNYLECEAHRELFLAGLKHGSKNCF